MKYVAELLIFVCAFGASFVWYMMRSEPTKFIYFNF